MKKKQDFHLTLGFFLTNINENANAIKFISWKYPSNFRKSRKNAVSQIYAKNLVSFHSNLLRGKGAQPFEHKKQITSKFVEKHNWEVNSQLPIQKTWALVQSTRLKYC